MQTTEGLGSNKTKVRAVITDQPTVMAATWQKIEEQNPHITCYGYAAHVINLLSGDFRKMDCIEIVWRKIEVSANFSNATTWQGSYCIQKHKADAALH